VARAGGGSLAGATDPAGAAEQEARAVASSFEAGAQSAPAITASLDAGVARDETEEGDAGASAGGESEGMARLREEADGNWIGDVDEAECLRLIAGLSTGEKALVRGDDGLMLKLAGAFDASEMVTCVESLGFELGLQMYWLQRAGVLSSVPGADYQRLWGAAPAARQAQLLDYMGGSLSAYDDFLEDAPTKLSPIWAALIGALPRGSAMPAGTRAALWAMADDMSVAQMKLAFDARFNTPAVDGSGSWGKDMLQAVWENLEHLPDQDVSDNTVLQTFEAISGTGAFWSGRSDIQIGQGRDVDAIGHTVRHEVGHAVHTELSGTVDAWCQQAMSFWFYSGSSAGYTSWINDLGGFPSNYTDESGAEKPFGDTEKARALALLQSFVGGGSSWSPARSSVTDGQSAADAAIWEGMKPAVKNAVTQSTSKWYKNHSNWQGGAKGKAFLNYWYAKPFYMGAAAEAVVNTCRDYTAMSHKELFADAYAEYFEDPAGAQDRTEWGGDLSGAVQTFFENNILDRQPYTPPGAPSPPTESGT